MIDELLSQNFVIAIYALFRRLFETRKQNPHTVWLLECMVGPTAYLLGSPIINSFIWSLLIKYTLGHDHDHGCGDYGDNGYDRGDDGDDGYDDDGDEDDDE